MHQRQPQKKAPDPKSVNVAPKPVQATFTRSPAWTNVLGSQPVLTLQPKLTVNQPGDQYEQEADQVAAQVMRMPTPTIQRCACGGIAGPDGECAACKAKRLGLQRKSNGIAHTEAPPSVHQPLHSSGQPLDASTRAFMEPRFGQDFSSVRVHTDSQAAQSAADVSARAYTVGNNVVFGAGQYAPNNNDGKQLLAHELTHVTQQSSSGGLSSQRSISPMTTSMPTMLQRLGANPGCTPAQQTAVHQAIFNARGWINRAIGHLETTPVPPRVISSLRSNFGPTYGVAANIPLIVRRLRVAYHELSTVPVSCAGAADATCATAPCGYTPGAGAHQFTLCTNASLSGDAVYDAGCVLHESLHAAFTNFGIDEYSGWHGHSGSTPTYPGTGTDPLLNADSYTTLVMDLSSR